MNKKSVTYSSCDACVYKDTAAESPPCEDCMKIVKTYCVFTHYTPAKVKVEKQGEHHGVYKS
jgi:hypothetical protein